MQNINLKKFDPKCMERRRLDPNGGPPTVIIVGSRGSGKTYLLSDLLYYFKRVPAGMIKY